MPWEIILVDDGSLDDTWGVIAMLHQQDDRVKGLRLSRNFGHQYALFAGLHYSRGDAVVTMDADLQHPPEVIPQLIAEWRNGYRIVNTVRRDSEDFSIWPTISMTSVIQLHSTAIKLIDEPPLGGERA